MKDNRQETGVYDYEELNEKRFMFILSAINAVTKQSFEVEAFIIILFMNELVC
jgi:hypothetical protein